MKLTVLAALYVDCSILQHLLYTMGRKHMIEAEDPILKRNHLIEKRKKEKLAQREKERLEAEKEKEKLQQRLRAKQ